MDNDKTTKVWVAKDIAKHYGVALMTVYGWINSGKIEVQKTRAGMQTRITVSDEDLKTFEKKYKLIPAKRA
jgi:predicted site-specific integrase-resolvase